MTNCLSHNRLHLVAHNKMIVSYKYYVLYNVRQILIIKAVLSIIVFIPYIKPMISFSFNHLFTYKTEDKKET